MEFIGKATKKSICKNCGHPITYIEWQGMEDDWSHDDQPYGRWCPGQYMAEPIEEEVVMIVEKKWTQA